MPKVWLPGLMKEIVCAPMVTAKVLLTAVAAKKLALPDWLALTVQLPTLTKVSVVPLTVQTAGVVDANVIARPELAVALKAAGVTPNTWAAGAAKVMLCAAGCGAGSLPPPPPQALKMANAAQASAGRKNG